MRLLRALSLDVGAGALCGGLLAEHMTLTHMRPAWWVALVTAVWSIYTGDHPLDALRTSGPLLTYRSSELNADRALAAREDLPAGAGVRRRRKRKSFLCHS